MSVAEQIINILRNKHTFESTELDISSKELHPVLLSLASKNILTFDINDTLYFDLTKEGELVYREGSHEYRLYNMIPSDGMSLEEIDKYLLGKINAFKLKWIRKDGRMVYRNVENVKDITKEMITNVVNKIYKADEIDTLKKRKLILQSKQSCYTIRRNDLSEYDTELVTELTSNMIINKSYENLKFKPYNFNVFGSVKQQGALHPLMKVREEIRKIFIEMGFQEMATNKFVESSFWNFDSLFQPQDHPSRDEQDTFFMSNPLTTLRLPESYVQKVDKIHSTGDFGSDGHFCQWRIEEAKRNILRSHTTACSARHLYSLANKNIDTAKLFSIDRVFRNEALDATHLAEFNQVEGVILCKNLTIGNLMGIIEQFFLKLGIGEVKFKPAYNPYTEPSMEVFGYHKQLQKWIEIGNSGMFRPEMLRPMGFAEDVRGIGFGLSLERPTMIKYGISNIRDLVGHKVDLEFIRKSQICLFK